MALQFLRRKVGILARGEEKPAPPALLKGLGGRMVASGLDETLELLVEHALLWVGLSGRPNERRSITLEQEITLYRRSLVRWSFGGLTNPAKPRPWWNCRWARLAGGQGEKGEVLKIGDELYGRRDRRFSTSSFGERIGQLLAWMPFEFDLPTIYTKRCGSYHFEVRCPPGRTPRDLKVSARPLLAESAEPKPPPVADARKAFSSRSARFDVPRGGLENVGRFRVIVGIGNGAFPLLWFLAGAVTAAMLWILAGSNPGLGGEHAQTTAGILLIVPALVAGLAAGSNEVPISQLIGGARLLLLTTGLSSVVAAAVLAGARPFHLTPSSTWSACAIVATVATLPLATSWLLSSPLIWRQMRKLNSYDWQKVMLVIGVALAAATISLLALLPDDTWHRVLFAGFLLLLMVVLSALASNRAVMPLGENRRYLGSAFLLAGLTCLALGCVELRCVISEHALSLRSTCLGPAGELDAPRTVAELGALALLGLSLYVGRPLNAIANWGAPRKDEIHLSPRSGRTLLEGESVSELPELFKRVREHNERGSGDRTHAQPLTRVTSVAN